MAPVIAYTKTKLQVISESMEPLKQLRVDLQPEERLGGCQLTLSETERKSWKDYFYSKQRLCEITTLDLRKPFL